VKQKPLVFKIKLKFKIGLLISAVLASCTLGCTVGPRYQRPTPPVPSAWKGEGPWQTAAPKDAMPKGTWWGIFHDAELDQLEQSLLQANQSLEAARDRLSEARSQARVVSSAFFPSVNADPSGEHQLLAGNRPLSGSTAVLTPFNQSVYTIPFNISYELDLFGLVRRNL
jgi:outer membrane protein, multidrug efflux system